MTHTRPGDEIICGRGAHVYRAEAGGYARISGASIYTVPQHRAGLDPADIAAGIHPDDPHNPRTALIWVEQPHSGWVMSLDNLAAIRALAREHGLPVHMDGARIFNAAVALGVPAAEIAGYADTVMFCVSKGLAAPVGSLLVGPADFIARARRNRKVLGGGLRQVGVIAAGGLYALNHNIERLAEDHTNARALAEGLRALGWTVDRDVVETNIIFVQPPAGLAPREVAAGLAERDVKVSSPYSGRTMRLVTHYGIEAADIARALDAFRAVTEGVGVAA